VEGHNWFLNQFVEIPQEIYHYLLVISFRKSRFKPPFEISCSCLWLASHLVREPNSQSGGDKFEFPVWIELGALTKKGKLLGSGLSTVVTPT
jgi:hypothetical protein